MGLHSPSIAKVLTALVLAAALALPAGASPPSENGTPSVQAAERLEEPEGEPNRVSSAARARRSPLARWLHWMKPGLLLFLCTTQPDLAVAQPGLPGPLALPRIRTLPSFNLSAPDPPSRLAAVAVTQALARANFSGGLPPLPELNTMIAGASPGGDSVLATLPELLDVPNPSFPSLSYGTQEAGDETGDAPGQNNRQALVDERVAILSVTKAAQLTEAYYTLASVSYDLLAVAAGLAYTHPEVAGLLEMSGNALQAIGYGLGAQASQVQVEAAHYALSVLDTRIKAQSKPSVPSPATGLPTAPTASGISPQDLVDPEFIFGVWQTVDAGDSAQNVTYKVTRTGIVKLNATITPDGTWVRNEVHTGAVSGYVSFLMPTGGTTLAEVGEVNVTLMVERLDRPPIALDFWYLRVNISGQAKDMLVAQDAARTVYLKVKGA